MSFNLSQFFFDVPIYTPISIVEDSSEFLSLFNNDKTSFEGYNSVKKIQSTFTIIRNLSYSGGAMQNNIYNNGGFGVILIKCKRHDDIFHFYASWNPQDRIITKVGQYPSVADFHIGEVKRYNKLLPKERMREFTRAIGLAASGVGIGSFVYLRRIFEFLIHKAYIDAVANNDISEGDFQRARMDEKIDLLKSYLPNFLVENKSMYSILSLGVHELNEDDCLAHFDTLRVGIEIILDEQLDELKKKEKIEAAKKKISELKGQIRK